METEIEDDFIEEDENSFLYDQPEACGLQIELVHPAEEDALEFAFGTIAKKFLKEYPGLGIYIIIENI